MARDGWLLSSNSGRESVSWVLTDAQPGGRGQVVTCDIHLAGQYFGSSLAAGDRELRDYELSLYGMAVGVVELERLSSTISTWHQLPLAEQARHKLAVECNVGALFDQSLTLILGRRDDRLSGGNPVATFKYLVGSLSGELVFVTDQSCLFGLAAGIHEALEELAT